MEEGSGVLTRGAMVVVESRGGRLRLCVGFSQLEFAAGGLRKALEGYRRQRQRALADMRLFLGIGGSGLDGVRLDEPAARGLGRNAAGE